MVNYITLKQTISRLYTNYSPSGNGCHTGLIPVGAANNWDCVNDPVATPDEDVTYVHENDIASKYDLYEIPDHTTETGTINYIEVYTRAKTNDWDVTGTYKILVDDGTCTELKKSDNKVLTSDYITYSEKWEENPMTDTEWTWNDFNALQIGIEHNSPTDYVATSDAFRPESDIAVNLHSVTCNIAPHFNCVNYVTPPDNDNDCVMNQTYNPVLTLQDEYHIPNHTAEQRGVITKVEFCWRIKENAEIGFGSTGQAIIHDSVHAQFYNNALNFTRFWTTTCVDYLVNPTTGVAWTWAEIDGIELRIRMRSAADFVPILKAVPFCNQIYIIVHYIQERNPEIRTTQMYAKVNYSTHCTLTAPEEVSDSHTQNVKMMNLWNGERIVFGLSRNKWGLVLTGREWYSGACDKITCIRDLGLDDLPITISGLNNINWDGDWRILSWGWKIISECPEHIEWILELEKYE